MKLFASFLALSVGVLPAAVAPSAIVAESSSASPIVGVWRGFATVHETQQVPITIRISSSGSSLRAEFLNGSADHPDATPASSVSFDGTHLIASFDYFARTLDATLSDGKLNGEFYDGNYSTAVSNAAVNDGNWHYAVLAAGAGMSVIIGCALCACAVGPDYRRPEAPVPVAYRSGAEQAGFPPASGTRGQERPEDKRKKNAFGVADV